jgi:pimeloyl-ACP methyl ester carboxylesterase
MTFARFGYTCANTLPVAEQRAAWLRYMVPESRRVPRQSLTARVDFRRPHAPLLLIAGAADKLIPASLIRTNHARYRRSPSVTDFKEFAGRSHSIILEKGWEEVADFVLGWLNDKLVQ